MKSHNAYLMIGGTLKAGTTSLFNYLADHPQICPSSLKETYFFLEPDHPLPAKYRFEDGLDKYEQYFRNCRGLQSWRMEATPHYLYSAYALEKIKASLPAVKFIFILREPVDRLLSVYRYLVQNNTLPASVSFEAYVRRQLDLIQRDEPRPPYMRALEHGRYSVYLEPYIKTFGGESVCVLLYEQLKRQPAFLLAEVCRFAGIDPAFYQDYRFRVFNPTQTMKSPAVHQLYLQFRRRLRLTVHDTPALKTTLQAVQKHLEPFYLQLNKGAREPLQIPEDLKETLQTYYADELNALARLLGSAPFSWTGEAMSPTPVAENQHLNTSRPL